MSFKNVDLGRDAREKMKRGLDTLANAVKVTLGPRGRHAAIEREYGPPQITKDGVTVARSINLSDSVENMGAQLIKSVAATTNAVAGDGTTTATVLSQYLYNEGSKMVEAGHNPVLIKRGMDLAVTSVSDSLKELSVQLSDSDSIKSVASISANNDSELGGLIADAVTNVGNDGMISVEESAGTATSVSYTDGLKIERGYLSPMFITNPEKLLVEMDNPLILCYDGNMSFHNFNKEYLPLFKKVSESGRKVLVIAKEFDHEVMSTFILNNSKGSISSCLIRAPGFGDFRRDMLGDIAAACGGKLFTDDSGVGFSNADVDDLGTARRVVVSRFESTIVDGGGSVDDIELRVSALKSQLKSDMLEGFEIASLKNRISKLSGGVAVIKVGGSTESEMIERKDRVEDAINAVKAAIEEGVVPGGGASLIHCIGAIESLEETKQYMKLLPEEKIGVGIVKNSLSAPFRQIMINSGMESQYTRIMDKIMLKKGFSGYNALSNSFSNDMLKSGIIDPTKVVRTAIVNAASASGIMLTTEVAISSEDETK